MKRYILTGTPGSGKTTLIRCLESLGYNVVDEAATDVIAEEQRRGEPMPWLQSDFIAKVVSLQIQQRKKPNTSLFQFFDRSPFCTLALSHYLKIDPPDILLAEIDAIKKESIYERKAFFIENLGHCEQTNARTISFEEALRFEKIHELVYHDHGIELIKIPVQSVSGRAKMILSKITL